LGKQSAIIGGGVIGAGWAARFLLMGWDVNIFDMDPEAHRKINEVLENARRSLPGLYNVKLPDEGSINFCDTIENAVRGAEWIQESVPERLPLKHKVYHEILKFADKNAIIASSTSGYKPSELNGGIQSQSRVVVAHPFNPVYLLPLIELVPAVDASKPMISRAQKILSEIGMYPLLLRKEIDAHIADRFLEAVWREALWLIKDDIATTEEIDDAIRFGFGLRWAQMGLFETYRIAGGEAGMRHFIEQFGPCLSWPWTKLMDVPELTPDLIDKIAGQSDAQSDKFSIRELERIRDNNLVGILRSLKDQNWGAGAHLRNLDRLLSNNDYNFQAPIETLSRAIPLDWVDYNGHMNEARYLQAFGDATDKFMELIGCDSSYINSGSSYFTAETHIRHLDEVKAGSLIRIFTQCLSGKGKKLHLFHRMMSNERVLATGEHILIHVSLETRRSSMPSKSVAAVLSQISIAHSKLPIPMGAGAGIGKR
jgi:carnitine 3-dehydrogenase